MSKVVVVLVATLASIAAAQTKQAWYNLFTESPTSPRHSDPGAITEEFTSPDGRLVRVSVVRPSGSNLYSRSRSISETDRDYIASLITYAKANGYDGVQLESGATYTLTALNGRHVYLNDLSDFVFDGNGSTLVMSDIATGISIYDAQRVLVKNLTFRYSEHLSSVASVLPQGKLEIVPAGRASHGTAARLVKVVDEWSYDADPTVARFTSSPSKERYSDASGCSWNGTTYQYTCPTPAYTFSSSHVVIRHYSYDAHGLLVSGKDTEDVSIEDVTIEGAPAMGIVAAEGKRGLRIKGLTIRQEVGQAAARPVSTVADGVHVGNWGGDVQLLDSTISYQGDDGVNLEGPVYTLVDAGVVNSKTVFSVKAKSNDFAVGERVALFSSAGEYLGYEEVEGLSTTTVVENGKNVSYRHVRLDAIVDNVAVDSVARNVERRMNRWVIKNNTFKNSRARAILAKGPNGYIFNNVIENTTLHAISLTTSMATSGGWAEGFGSDNVLIKQNHIKNVGWRLPIDSSSANVGAITVNATLANGSVATSHAHREVVIEDNVIEGCAGPGIFVASAEQVTIRNNELKLTNQRSESKTFGTATTAGTGVLIYAADVKSFTGNTFASASNLVGYDTGSVNVTVTASPQSQFSNEQGKHGWFYGRVASGTTTVIPYDHFDSSGSFWTCSTGSPSCGTYSRIYSATMHPINGVHTLRQFRAPAAGTYTVSGDAAGVGGTCGDGVEVQVRKNDTVQATCSIAGNNGPNNCSAISQNITVLAGDLIGIAVDAKATGSCDMTRVNLSIEKL